MGRDVAANVSKGLAALLPTPPLCFLLGTKCVDVDHVHAGLIVRFRKGEDPDGRLMELVDARETDGVLNKKNGPRGMQPGEPPPLSRLYES